MVPVFTYNTLNHFIIDDIFRIRIWATASTVHSTEVLVVAVELIHGTFVLKQDTERLLTRFTGVAELLVQGSGQLSPVW
jgi:hypothetical protein